MSASFYLSLDLQTLNFYPGEFVNGKLFLNLGIDYASKQLLIKVEGRKSFTPSGIYPLPPLFNQIICETSVFAATFENSIIAAGEYVFNFSIQLPNNLLPSLLYR